jgi:hypothetical protein
MEEQIRLGSGHLSQQHGLDLVRPGLHLRPCSAPGQQWVSEQRAMRVRLDVIGQLSLVVIDGGSVEIILAPFQIPSRILNGHKRV